MTPPQVVLRRLSRSSQTLPRCRDALSAAEQREMARFLRASDRDRFALARATLREAAAAALHLAPADVVVERDALGKPSLPQGQGLACNVSHSGDVVAVAIGAAHEIGVDVEAHREDLDHAALALSFMTTRERAVLLAAPGSQRAQVFFRQWCFKEALVKALGTGLTRDPARFEIRFEADTARPVFVGAGVDDVGAGWRLTPLDVGDGYSGALIWR